ncbi:MAG: hypothetical protein Q4F56_00830 [Candidatus Saccharibacteria bacterium]|nr:hypothetical protein [Candidatus Saccharibacteria bacterium]
MTNKYLAVGLLSVGSLICSPILASTKTTADQVVDFVAVSIPVSCSMSGSIASGEEHNAEIQNGIYQDDVGKTTLEVFCNDGEGFSIYTVGYTNNEYCNNKLASNTLGSSHDIVTGTATSGNNSNWAMKLSTDSTATYPLAINDGFDDYSAVPSSYAKAATRLSGTDASVKGASLTTTYAAFISPTQSADTYSGQVKYTLVHPSSETPSESHSTDPGYIAYYPNTNVYEGSMGLQSLSSVDTSATLFASNYSRAGYGFAGWNTAHDYSGNFYGPNETINFEAGEYTNGDEGLSLYAVWIKSEGFIQGWSGCSNLAQPSYDSTTGSLTANLSSITALTDLRDNQTYAVAKLADGKCWMIENLRLSANYTKDASSPSLSQGYGQSEVYGNFIGLADPENSSFSNTSTPNSLYSYDGSTTVNIGTVDSPNYRLPRYNSSNTITRTTDPAIGDANYYSYGNYYNWPAAMASTKYYTSGYISDEQESSKSNLASTSLCPSGWRLPYGSSINGGTYDGDLALLDDSMGGTGYLNSVNNVTGLSMSYYWRQFPNNIIYSGDINNSSINSRGSYGYLWTTTAFDYDKSYGMSIGESYINPGIDTYNKFYGFAVRCTIEN